MPVEHRHPHHRRVHPDAVVAEDLARLPHQLHFLGGVAVVGEIAAVRDHVERDLHRIHLRLDRLEVEQARGLLAQFLQRAPAGAGHGLVGRDVQALDADGAVDRRERDQHLHGRAVGVGDDPARALPRGLRIDFAHHQRHVIVVAEGRGVVDHHRARGGEFRRVFLRDRSARGEQRDIDAGRIEGRQVLHDDVAIAELHLATGRALARQRHQFADRELAFRQHRQHHLAHRAGGADDCDLECPAHLDVCLRVSRGDGRCDGAA